MNKPTKITDAELEVMRILWRERRPVTFADIRSELQKNSEWEKSTINTLIRRLADKGVISAEKKDVIYYTPIISEEEYAGAEEQSLLDKLYSGSAKNLVAAFVQSGKLSEQDIDELKEYFRMEGEK